MGTMNIRLCPRPSPTNERGFTLIEVLAVVALLAILLTLSAPALRTYWFTQSLHSATDEAVSLLRRLQARVTSESHPLVYGARFRKGSSDYALILYDPRAIAPAPACTQDGGTRAFNTGVFNATVRVSATTTAVPDSSEAAACRAQLPGVTTNDVFVFFYARGTATPGTIRLEQPNLDRGENVTISGLTGRVERT